MNANAELLAACETALARHEQAELTGSATWTGEEIDAMKAAVAKAKRQMITDKHCLVCESPRDGGRIWCGDDECLELVKLIPTEVINKIREREAIAALRGSNGTAAFIHITPKEEP